MASVGTSAHRKLQSGMFSMSGDMISFIPNSRGGLDQDVASVVLLHAPGRIPAPGLPARLIQGNISLAFNLPALYSRRAINLAVRLSLS
jgi:hypothetical protein